MSFDEGIEAFVTECHELLEEMESALLEWEGSADLSLTDPEIINRIFRAMHTIKGSAGLFGFDDIIQFTHVAESLLSDVRKGEIPVTGEICAALIKCKDHVETMVGALEGGDPADPEQSVILIDCLNAFMEGVALSVDHMGSSDSASQVAANTLINTISRFHVDFTLDENTFREGFDPALHVRALKALGACSQWAFHSVRLPSLQNMESDCCYLSWGLEIEGDITEEQIQEVFEFSEGTQLQVKKLKKSVAVEQSTCSESRENVVSSGVEGSGIQASRVEGSENDTSAGAAQTLEESGTAVKQQKTKSQAQLRVSALKLDKLINLVGEMVTMHTQVAQVVEESANEELIESISGLKTTLEEVRESALSLRMIAIGSTLERFKRVVRDVSKELDKTINLEIMGGDTELDKAVIEQISDPLLHMLRNSIDHGIEPPGERVRAGKPAQGTILLRAFHESGAIVLEITDDGRGLDKNKILSKARDQGIVGTNQQLQDSEIYGLIFTAGFSTSKTISSISGRGVGMDVVRRNIEELRGQIDVESILGKGTRFTMRIPLTLSIIDGFLVKIVSDEYVIPLAAINECIAMERDDVDKRSDGHNLINLRGELLPLLYLDEYLGLDKHREEETFLDDDEVNIVVVEFAGKRIGLVVDELVGEIQAVIKPLGRIFHGMSWVSGFTILGGGNVALIFDIAGLIKEATSRDCYKSDSVGLSAVARAKNASSDHLPRVH